MKIFVSFASVADLHDGDNFRAIVNFIDYAVVSCPDAPRLMTTHFRLPAGRGCSQSPYTLVFTDS